MESPSTTEQQYIDWNSISIEDAKKLFPNKKLIPEYRNNFSVLFHLIHKIDGLAKGGSSLPKKEFDEEWKKIYDHPHYKRYIQDIINTDPWKSFVNTLKTVHAIGEPSLLEEIIHDINLRRKQFDLPNDPNMHDQWMERVNSIQFSLNGKLQQAANLMQSVGINPYQF